MVCKFRSCASLFAAFQCVILVFSSCIILCLSKRPCANSAAGKIVEKLEEHFHYSSITKSAHFSLYFLPMVDVCDRNNCNPCHGPKGHFTDGHVFSIIWWVIANSSLTANCCYLCKFLQQKAPNSGRLKKWKQQKSKQQTDMNAPCRQDEHY